jgi:hypothetical protein
MTRVVITEEPEESDEPEDDQGLAGRHPELAYVFGDAIRAFYIVGCLALDLFTPLQIFGLLSGQPTWAIPPLVFVFGFVAFLEYRLYRRLWPPRTKRQVIADEPFVYRKGL